MPLDPLPPGSPFPEIAADTTAVWVEFWNIVFRSWIEDYAQGSGALGGWPSVFVLEGRIVEAESDGLEVQMPGSASLALVLPEGSKWLIDGRLYEIDTDTTVGGISANFTGWLELRADYDEELETVTFSFDEHETRPSYGAGVVGKVVTISDRVDSIDVDETEADIIPTLPLILNRIRVAATTGGSGGGGDIAYISELGYSAGDPRPATVVIEEKITQAVADVIDQIESGGSREAPTEVDQLWDLSLGLLRGLREVLPYSVEFLQVGAVRPGIQGTESAPESTVFDLGGTLPEVADERHYDAS